MIGICYFPLIECIIDILSSIIYEISVGINILKNISYVLSYVKKCNCFREDGLADIFDGMSSGWGKEYILAIMVNFRIDTYESVSLIIFILTK